MPSRKCFVTGCKSGSRKKMDETDEKISFFSAPKDADLMAKWIKALPKRSDGDDRQLVHSKVCSKHFNEVDIRKVIRIVMPNDETLIHPMNRWALMPGAIPSIFPGTSHKYTCHMFVQKELTMLIHIDCPKDVAAKAKVVKKRTSPEERRVERQQRVDTFKKQSKQQENNLPRRLEIIAITQPPPTAAPSAPVDPLFIPNDKLSTFKPPASSWHTLASSSRPSTCVFCFETLIINERPTVVKSAEIHFGVGRIHLTVGERRLAQSLEFDSIQKLEDLLIQFHLSPVCSGVKSSKSVQVLFNTVLNHL